MASIGFQRIKAAFRQMEAYKARFVVGAFLAFIGLLCLTHGLNGFALETNPQTPHYPESALVPVDSPSERALPKTSPAEPSWHEVAVPLADLWEETPKSLPSRWTLRSMTGFAVVLILLLIFFRWVFPALAQKNPQWRQPPNPSIQPTQDEALPPDPEPDLKTFLHQVSHSKPKSQSSREAVASREPLGYTESMPAATQASPLSSSFPLQGLPLTIVREFVVGQGVRLQLVTVWDRYLVILHAQDGTELVGEVLCDHQAECVRFKETDGPASARIQWLFQYHAAAVQQCVDVVAQKESAPQPEPNSGNAPLHNASHESETSMFSHASPSPSLSPLSSSSWEQQADVELFFDEYPAPETQNITDSKAPFLHPESPGDRPPTGEGLYLKYLNPSPPGPVSSHLAESPQIHAQPPFSEKISEDLETLPKPWYTQPPTDSPDWLQSRALKETLNQMVHEVLAAERRQTYSEQPQHANPPQTLFDEAPPLPPSDPTPNHARSASPDPVETDSFYDETLLNLADSETVLDTEPLPLHGQEPAPPSLSERLPSTQSSTERPVPPKSVVLGELDLDAPTPQINAPQPPVSPDKGVQKLPEAQEVLPPLTDRHAREASETLPDTLSEAMSRPAPPTISEESPSDVYPISGLARRNDSKHAQSSVDPVHESLQELLFPQASATQNPQTPLSPTAQAVPLSERRQAKTMPQPAPQLNPPVPDEIVVLDDYDDVF